MEGGEERERERERHGSGVNYSVTRYSSEFRKIFSFLCIRRSVTLVKLGMQCVC